MGLFGCKDCRKCSTGSKCSDGKKLTCVILVGNPNVGKSVIFNALSGFYVEVSNYPGTTVDVSRATNDYAEIIDTPGTYALEGASEDEAVTRDIITKADVVVNVVSALSLERDLLLTQQLIDFGFPLLIALNQMDEAEKRGIVIDIEKLQVQLGITVVSTVAIKGVGITKISDYIQKNEFKSSGKVIPYVEENLKDLSVSKRMEKLAVADKDEISKQRRNRINEIYKDVVSSQPVNTAVTDFFSALTYNPIVNALLSIFVLVILFEIIGVFVSGNVVDFLYGHISEDYYPWITSVVSKILPFEYIREVFVGEFGILTMTIGILLGILLPLLTAFYLLMAILEDSGYLPRLAAFADNFLNKIGLNGRAIIPILLGFGCGTMGTLTTRILGSKKERSIATAIIGITIPCAAQMGIIIALLASIGGLKVWLIYILVIFLVMALAGTILDKLLPGTSTHLLINIPPLRYPRFLNILKKVSIRIMNFLQEAFIVFSIGSLIITFLYYFGVLKWLQKALEPIVIHLLHLPAQFSDVFVMGLIRRDFASVGLYEMAGITESAYTLAPIQILTAAVVITLFVPCFAALVLIYKERGLKEATILWVGTFIISVGVGSIVANCLGFLF